MIRVEGGTFTMGATHEQLRDACDDEKPAHMVTLDSFYIGETPVTQALWKEVMGTNPSHFIGDTLPVECVSWDSCQEFVSRLNAMTGKLFRLPTEAEWEFAARGGNKSKGYVYSGSNLINEVLWYKYNSDGNTHPVAQKKANELGLYDMTGNVCEWCQDCYGRYPKSAQSNPTGLSGTIYHVRRGGSWYDFATDCRSSSRSYSASDFTERNMGFRLCASEL